VQINEKEIGRGERERGGEGGREGREREREREKARERKF